MSIQKNNEVKKLIQRKTKSPRCFFCFSIILSIFLIQGCSLITHNSSSNADHDTLYIDNLIGYAYTQALNQSGIVKTENSTHYSYLDELIKDGEISIALGIGTRDLGKIVLPENSRDFSSERYYVIKGRKILVKAHLVLTRDDFRNALEKDEIVFTSSHSRFGAGPVFLSDGKALPFRMQRSPNYNITMPLEEVSGYKGKIKRKFKGPLKRKSYVVFKPDSTDLDNTSPFPGYQILVMSTCTSRRHFFDEIKNFREGLPTTAVFTTKPCCMDTQFRVFMRFLYEIFQEKPVNMVVEGMSQEYVSVAWENINRQRPPWKVVKNLYVNSINSFP